jgi:hypothetical protein
MDYVRRLVAVHYLDEAAVAIIQSRRDTLNVGIGLRAAAARPQQTQATPQQGKQQAAAAAPVWVSGAENRRYRCWDSEKWVWQE